MFFFLYRIFRAYFFLHYGVFTVPFYSSLTIRLHYYSSPILLVSATFCLRYYSSPLLLVSTQFVSLLLVSNNSSPLPFVSTTIRLHYYSSSLIFVSATIRINYSSIIHREWISCHFWLNRSLFGKSIEIGTEVVWYVTSDIKNWANGPMVATSMFKYGQKLKSSRKVIQTSFLNCNDCYWILSNFGLWKFYHKILLKLANWQLILISRKINFEYGCGP